MIGRRGFLGSVIGSFIGGNFLAKTIIDTPQHVILPQYKMAFREVNENIWIQAPGIKEIIQVDKAGFQFNSEKFESTKTLLVDSVSLWTQDNKHIWTSKFDRALTILEGDTLNVNQRLAIGQDIEVKSHEELVRLYLGYQELIKGHRIGHS